MSLRDWPRQLFVGGISTEVGKTLVAGILAQGLKAAYWKPVQTGAKEEADQLRIQSWSNFLPCLTYPEVYHFLAPISPHAAAAREGQEIQLQAFQLPTSGPLVVEGAGGLLSPLSPKALMIDLIQHLGLPVVLVSRHYLGSINHTLLSLEALQKRNMPILGVIFNGEPNPESEEFILKWSGVPCLGRLFPEPMVTSETLARYAQAWALPSFS